MNNEQMFVEINKQLTDLVDLIRQMNERQEETVKKLQKLINQNE